jgi:hypothetical protein
MTDAHIDVYLAKKASDDTEWYEIDFSGRIRGQDTIASAAWTVPSGITNLSTAIDGKSVFIKLGEGVSGTSYKISCQVTTSRPEEKTDWFYVTVL